MKKYIITASCDPYHSKTHYRGQEVLKYDGATPTRWIMERDLTLDEAYDVLDRYTYDLGDDYNWEDDQSIAALREELMEYEDMSKEEAVEATSWYQGEGVYVYGGKGDILYYKHGEDGLRDDVVTYRIEEDE